MKQYVVIWVHVLGGANSEYVSALSPDLAKKFIERRQGANNLKRISVRPL